MHRRLQRLVCPEIRRSSQWISTSAALSLPSGHSTRETHRKSFLGHSMPRGIRPRNIYIYILNPVVLFMREGGTSAGSGSNSLLIATLFIGASEGKMSVCVPQDSPRRREERIHWTRERERERLRDAESLEMFDSCRYCEIVLSCRRDCSFPRRIATRNCSPFIGDAER